MKRILTLSISDFHSTFREPVFKVLLLMPFIVFVLLRWVLPPLVQQFPVMAPYQQVIVMWACMQSATMFGVIYGFLFLEEKEEQLWPVIQVTPVPVIKIVIARLLTGFFVSSLVNYSILHFGNIVHFPFYKEIILSLLYSLAAPLIAVYVGAIAKNRIEGMVQMKVLSLLLIIPALIYFLPWKALHILAIVPTYWSYRALEKAGDTSQFFLFTGIGFLLHGLIIGLLNKKLATGSRGSEV